MAVNDSRRDTCLSLPRIFVGGTGRSGTSIFYRALGYHENVLAFPQEMRFVIDPDGLKDLLDASTVRYAPAYAREAVYKFERLMRVYLTTPERPPYRGFDLARWIGPDYYWKRLDLFCSQLVELQFAGTAWQVQPEYEGRAVEWARRLQELRQRLEGKAPVPRRLTLPRTHLKVAKYFPERSDVVALAADFVDDLFLYAARREEKRTWSEKTPHSIYYLNFLWELFPDSVFIHIKRDPRGVVHSMTKDSWKRAPRNVTDVCTLLRHMYDRWFDVKKAVELSNHRYLELKIEDVATSPDEVFDQVASFCSLPVGFGDLPEINPQRVNYWRKSMSRGDLELVNEKLGHCITGMGYEL